jgi:hypothetical protein
VTYKSVKGNDGSTCIVATGNTHPKKDILHGTGFKWNPNKKLWWRQADAA